MTQRLSSAAIEKLVKEIWSDVLEIPDGQENATFFELQGQSVSAVRIVARIEDEIGVMVDMGDLFEDPDLETFTRDVVALATKENVGS
ncbi:Phosphopantetheine attachment site [Amycolatopsis arida]|uniref:Phosphopantetheine attachment site n=1 Tax=Amycolatopsis arida TaxID=587909 RepID=A0A1I5QAX7_9PSEU|nr:phosphopantetheine-binding protein [Amycolatopsis arida]TDX98775.1 phosphopantetheine binding protein [Amycolatopsis arida]SFP43393.1 Phosphopantetheine attachment site [Amycolatopsis arida]